jgi:hypothetical protein
MTRAPRWLKPVNKIYMVLRRRDVSFGAERPLVLTVRGRRSGRPRSTPITPMAVDGQRFCRRGLPGCRLGGKRPRRRRGEARLVARGVSRAAVVPGTGACRRRLPENSGLVNDGTPGELEALAGRLPVFRIDPFT